MHTHKKLEGWRETWQRQDEESKSRHVGRRASRWLYAWQGHILKLKGGDEYEGMWKSSQSRYGPGRYGWARMCLPGRNSEARIKSDICSANISQPKSTKHSTATSILFSSIRSESTTGEPHRNIQSINTVSMRCESALDIGYGVTGGIRRSSCNSTVEIS